jgi:hypothetical protein
MVKRSSIGSLPKEVRAWLDSALIDGNFSRYEALEVALQEKGYLISKSAIHRYGMPLQRRLAAIKASTEAARMLTEGAADDQDARSEAVIALVQTELFETLVNLQEATDESIKPEQRVKLLSTAAKNIATLSRASVNLKKYQADVRQAIRQELLNEQAQELEASFKAGGMNEEQVMFWRKKFLGVQ